MTVTIATTATIVTITIAELHHLAVIGTALGIV